MRIVFVTSFFGVDYGGAEVSTKLLMAKLIDNGHDVYALTTRKVSGKNKRIISLPYASHIPKKVLTLGNTLIDQLLAKELGKKVRELNPDLVHIQDTYILPASVLANKKMRIPLTVTVRNNVLDWVYDLISPFPFSTLLKRRNKVFLRCLKEVDAIIAVSHYIKRELMSIGVDANRIFPIYNLYPTFNNRWQTPLQGRSSKIRLLAPGLLSRYKGFFVLINAMKIVRERERNIELIIAGGGPERRSLENLTEELGLKEVTKFVGKVPFEEMAELYLSCDIVVFPSVHPEAFGRVALEAMTFGKPVIASDVGGIPEMVKDGETGFLVPPNNSEKLAEAILNLIRNHGLRESFGVNGMIVARQNFSPEKIVDQHLSVYEKVMRAN